MAPGSTILDSESTYAKGFQQQLALVNQLRAVGAQTDLDLPRIAVIGNQSAGKSSLVEAISGINVPRDAGTCTRVPIECRMSHTDSKESWRCQVSIRWEFDAGGARQNDVQEMPFGAELKDPKDVESILRRAQAAVLNPKMFADQVLRMGAAELKKLATSNQLRFSRNAICVDISGPQLADIAFVDLPGIIQNAEPDVVDLVEEVVKFHIRGNCLILVALPMSDDIENQKAMRLAREIDPNGLRTIGVLTKPDVVTTNQQRACWLDVIEGRAHPLQHGYYCTRQPDEDQRARGITASEARASEADFFLQTLPWVRSSHQTRFGTQNLVANLSRLLAKVIGEKIPMLSQETEKQLSECAGRLDLLPSPISSEPISFILGLVTAFRGDVQAYVDGNVFAASLVQTTHHSYRTFQKAIRSTAPHFVPFTDKKHKPTDLQHILQLEEDEDATLYTPNSAGDFISLTDVRVRIEQSRTRELPNNVPYPAKVTFIRDFQKTWQSNVRACADAVLRALQAEMSKLLKARFGSYVHLEPKIGRIINDLIQLKYKQLNAQLERILNYETTPYTQNEHYLSASGKAFLAQYKALRAQSASNASLNTIKPTPAQAAHTITNSVSSFGVASEMVYPTSPNHYQPWQPSRPVYIYNSPGTRGLVGLKCGVVGIKESALGQVLVFQNIIFDPTPREWSVEEIRATDYATLQNGLQQSPFNPALHSPPPKAEPQQVPCTVESPFVAAGLAGTGFGISPAASSVLQSPAPAPAPGTQSTQPRPEAAPSPFTVSPVRHAIAAAPVAPTFPFVPSRRGLEEDSVLQQLARLGFTGVTLADLEKLRQGEEYEEELEVMAEVRAYFKVAYKRIIDYVPLAIDHDFLYSFAESLQETLIEKLGVGSKDAAERCAAYLAEDPHVAATREELLARKRRLEKVQEELLNFGL